LAANEQSINLVPTVGTALHSAAFWGHMDVAKELLEAGADVDLKSPDWGTVSWATRVFALEESSLLYKKKTKFGVEGNKA
jgi:ankyrin repeat protein